MGQLQTTPTFCAEINSLLDSLLAGVQSILGEELIGFYLDGSLALGDFDPTNSDVDFIAAIANSPPPIIAGALAAMHRRITTSGRPYATELEGSYIPLRALRRHDPADAFFLNIERGPGEVLCAKEHHSDWVIHRYIVREHGIALFGPPPATLIDPITPDDLRRATTDVLRSWWGTPEADETIRHAHPGYWAYVVQTMCRTLYTMEYGQVVSKPVACRWAMENLDSRWHPLIEGGIQWGIGPDLLTDLLELVQFTSG